MTKRTQIKICGLTHPDDARLAATLGARFLGLVFVPGTPRCLTIDQAKAVMAGVETPPEGGTKPPQWVGVFQNQPVGEVLQIQEALGLDFVQLHGDELPEHCRYVPVPVIKTVMVAETVPFQQIAPYLQIPEVKAILLEREKPFRGHPWPQEASGEHAPWWLAGGLTPDSVGALVASHRPFVVDVSSGIETTPGRKDPDKLRAFVQAVQDAQVCYQQDGGP